MLPHDSFHNLKIQPVDLVTREKARNNSRFSIGNNVHFLNENKTEKSKVYLVSFPFNEDNEELFSESHQAFRKTIYTLVFPNWDISFIDLGCVESGETYTETQDNLLEIINWVSLDKQARVIVLGLDSIVNQAIALKIANVNNGKVNIASVDRSLDLDKQSKKPNFLSKIINNKSIDLIDYKLIGYQNYFTAQEELDLLEQLNFSALRLGELGADISLSEPEFRDANLVSFNLSSLQYPDFVSANNTINGFNSREACALCRYIGLSEELNVFGLFFDDKIDFSEHEAMLLSQMIWCFLDGFNQNLQYSSFKLEKKNEKFTVLQGDDEIVFLKEIKSARWYMQLPYKVNNKMRFIPCSEADYEMAKKGELPKKWWRANKKHF